MYDVLVTGAKQRSVLRDLSGFYIVMKIGFYGDNIFQKITISISISISITVFDDDCLLLSIDYGNLLFIHVQERVSST
jgi:hypothetical protein